MTITIERPKAPAALSDNHPQRRQGGMPTKDDRYTSGGSKVRSRRFLTLDSQAAAAAYWEERQGAKFLRAYLGMRPGELEQFIRDLESREGNLSVRDQSKLKLARQALALREAEGISVPSVEIPSNATTQRQQVLLRFHLGEVDDRLRQLEGSADAGMRGALYALRNDLYGRLEALKPKKRQRN